MPLSLGEIVSRLGGELVGSDQVKIRQVATLEKAAPDTITFLANERYLRQLKGTRAGAVIVGPHASELIHPLTIAVEQRLTVDELAAAFTVYPSLSGSISEAARRLHIAGE